MTAQQTLKSFMRAWCDGDPVAMEQLMQRSFQATATETLMVFLGAWYEQNRPHRGAWRILRRLDHSPLFVEFHIRITASDRSVERRVNLVCEAAPFEPHAQGTWGVNPISALEELAHE